jgi:hypothetical protein
MPCSRIFYYYYYSATGLKGQVQNIFLLADWQTERYSGIVAGNFMGITGISYCPLLPEQFILTGKRLSFIKDVVPGSDLCQYTGLPKHFVFLNIGSRLLGSCLETGRHCFFSPFLFTFRAFVTPLVPYVFFRRYGCTKWLQDNEL